MKYALRRTPGVLLESVQMRMIVNMTQGLRKCGITTVLRVQNAKKTGNASGVENLCQPTARVSARIAESRTREKTNVAEVAYRALSVRCMVSVIGAGKTQ